MDAIRAEIEPAAPHEHVDAPIAEAGILRRQVAHRFEHRRILQRRAQLVTQRRSLER
jgi:hypothetical protein